MKRRMGEEVRGAGGREQKRIKRNKQTKVKVSGMEKGAGEIDRNTVKCARTDTRTPYKVMQPSRCAAERAAATASLHIATWRAIQPANRTRRIRKLNRARPRAMRCRGGDAALLLLLPCWPLSWAWSGRPGPSSQSPSGTPTRARLGFPSTRHSSTRSSNHPRWGVRSRIGPWPASGS